MLRTQREQRRALGAHVDLRLHSCANRRSRGPVIHPLHAGTSSGAVGFALDVIINLCYIVDVFVSWRTTYYNREGMLVTEKKEVRNKYLRTWFWIDVFAISGAFSILIEPEVLRGFGSFEVQISI